MTSLRSLTVVAMLAAAVTASPARAVEPQPAPEPFSLPALAWPSDALEPAIEGSHCDLGKESTG